MWTGPVSTPCDDQSLAQQVPRLEHEIAILVVTRRRQFGGEWPGQSETVLLRRSQADPVAAIGKGDETFEKMVAVGPLADDMQCQVDLGGRRPCQREARNLALKHAVIRTSCPAQAPPG